MFSKYFLSLIFTLLFFVSFGALAQEKPVLNIYTYDSFAADWGPGPKLKEKFEQNCNCTINLIAASNSISSLRKIQLEGEQTKADILLGIDTSIAAQALETGLFIKHEIDVSDINIPNAWSSDYFVPFDYGYFAFVYNKEKLKNPPTSFADLIKQDIKIIVQDPRSSTPGLGLVLWIKSIYKEQAKNIWSELKPKIVTMTKGWSESYNLFLKGEADMVLSYTTSPAYHKIVENDNRFEFAQFEKGHYLQIEVGAIVKSSKNQALAKQFLVWLISEEAQEIIPTTNWMYPVANIELPKGFMEQAKPKKALLIDEVIVFENSEAWVLEMLDAFK